MGYSCFTDIGDSPENGYINFDNLGWAIIAVNQIITLDNADDLYDKVQIYHSIIKRKSNDHVQLQCNLLIIWHHCFFFDFLVLYCRLLKQKKNYKKLFIQVV